MNPINGASNNGATNLKRSNAILRRNSPILSAEQRPSVLRQNALLSARRTRQSKYLLNIKLKISSLLILHSQLIVIYK
jgi:hypothetical protein